MNFEVSNIRLIEEEYLKNFELKDKLSEVELYGLELTLVKLLHDCGDSIADAYETVDSFTRHLEDNLDILDGREDILYIRDYKVLSVHLTVNGIVVLKCLKDEYEYNDGDHTVYYATVG